MRGACKLRTICEVLREINDMHQGDTDADKQTRSRLIEAEAMAKKMDKKLLKYAKHYHRKFFKENPEYEKRLEERLNKSYLTGEK